MDTFYELLDRIDKNIEEHCNLATKMIQDHDRYANVLLTILAEENNETLSDVDKEEIHPIVDQLLDLFDFAIGYGMWITTGVNFNEALNCEVNLHLHFP